MQLLIVRCGRCGSRHLCRSQKRKAWIWKYGWCLIASRVDCPRAKLLDENTEEKKK